MNAGYVRLSRDDDRRNYISIENQKLIIKQYAASQNTVIDRWYEDDGVSGYKFDRPGFHQLMEDLDKDIDTVFVKDFSRLGRHNAKVLLLLDEFQERGKRLVVIDDNYDSLSPDDDVIGIKTWYNEKYVKDTSKKIRRVLGARQKEGTLLTHVPFGYKRNTKDKSIIEIVPEEARQIKRIYELYIQGCGYRKIAAYLTKQHIPTPSAIRHERELAEGRLSKRKVAAEWSDNTVKEILDNDFYIGTYRLHKRARATVHGKDRRVPKEEQNIFKNHHPAVIDKFTFELVQEMKEKRVKTNYHGNHGQWAETNIPNPFGSCLFCKDCKKRLTPIVRKTTCGVRKYYICTTYNTKGKRYCPKAHLMEENDLMDDVMNYIRLCRNTLSERIAAYDLKDFESSEKTIEEKCQEIRKTIEIQKKQLKSLLTQKVKDLAENTDSYDLIHESYHDLQNDFLTRIHALELHLNTLQETSLKIPDVKKNLPTALDIVDEIIKSGTLDRKDMELLIERIEVDENGFPEIELKYGLSGLIPYSPSEELNRSENEILLAAMKLISENNRNFTSANYLSEKLTAIGYQISKKSVLPYIHLMIDRGLIEPTENPRKPYTVIKTKEEIEKIIGDFQENVMPYPDCASHLHGNETNRWYAGNGI